MYVQNDLHHVYLHIADVRYETEINLMIFENIL